MSKRKKKGKSKGKHASPFRRAARRGGFLLIALFAAFATFATWYVHHPRAWLDAQRAAWPAFLLDPILSVGGFCGDITDALDLTGDDAVYEYDVEAPAGQIFFAGVPHRVNEPAPDDIVILDRGEFKIGFSPRLRHPVWCAYHVTREARYSLSRRNFQRDRAVPSAPNPGDYAHSGYDRGHMVPNYAIATRYGETAQKKTFRMSNIAPQTGALNRGPWRDFEHRIADLWTARYGEIWVIVGAISETPPRLMHGTAIDIPRAYYQLIVAQEGMDVRALAILLPQDVPYHAYAAQYIITIDELEALTGLDFLPDLPSFIQSPLEAERPTRLWPIRLQDALQLIGLRFKY